MNRSHTRVAIASVGLVGVLAIAGTVAATGHRVGDLGTAKARCTAAIAQRQATIDTLSSKATGAAQLTDAHENTIASFLSATDSGLAEVQTKVDADTDLATLKTDCESVATEFRVYALRAPQVHLAIAGDREAAALAKATTIATKLDAAIQTAAAEGKDVTDETATLAHLNGLLADASAQLSGLVDGELAITPAQWNSNHTVLASTTAAVHTVQNDLRGAMADAKAIVAGLKA